MTSGPDVFYFHIQVDALRRKSVEEGILSVEAYGKEMLWGISTKGQKSLKMPVDI